MAEVLITAPPPARRQLSGVERWAVELSARLPALAPDRYAVARPPRALAYGTGQAWEQLALPALARVRGARIVLSPANLAPLGWPANVVVIHDAVALAHPEWFSRGYAAWHRRLLPIVARRALRVVAVSAYAREEIVAWTGVAAERVSVVAGGVGERFRPEADAADAARALGLEREYVLCVAPAGPRKDLTALTPAARALAARGLDLVVAGSRRSHRGAADAVPGARMLGYVDDALLPGLYAGARAFVLPSRHEGFGLPCLEAMACGAPVVATRAGALPETCGDAALLVEPGDPGALAGALVALVEDADRAAELSARGLRRAAERSWARTVREIDALVAETARTL